MSLLAASSDLLSCVLILIAFSPRLSVVGMYYNNRYIPNLNRREEESNLGRCINLLDASLCRSRGIVVDLSSRRGPLQSDFG